MSHDVWIAIALALLGSSVVAGVVTTILTGVRAAATERREGYARAVRLLIARAEYPYRVRRRVNDEPHTLADLVNRGHDLQEQLAACRTWVRAEKASVGVQFERVLARIDDTVHPATAEAWNLPPISDSKDMNLGGWGPGDSWAHLELLQAAIAFRFGWRRAVPAVLWRRLIG